MGLTIAKIDAMRGRMKPYEVRDGEVMGLLLRVQPSGKKAWYLTFLRADGKRTRIKIGRFPGVTPTVARMQANKHLGAVAEGRDPQKEKQHKRKDAKTGTLKAFLDNEYGPWVQSHRKAGKSTLRRLITCFDAEFGTKKLSDLTSWTVEKWRNQRIKRGTAKATCNRDTAVLKAALTKAVEWEILNEHPLQNLKPLKNAEKNRVRFLSVEEEGRLLPVLETSDPLLRTLVVVARHTGLRRGELLSLAWTAVDFERRQVTVAAQNAKSGKVRYIPLNTAALEALRAWRQANPADGLVFRGKTADMIKRPFKALFARAAIVDLHLHDLRHDFASQLVMRGVDLRTVQELMGHACIVQTQKYAHLAPKHKTRAIEELTKPLPLFDEAATG